MSEWCELEEFINLYQCSKQDVLDWAKEGKVELKKQNDLFYVKNLKNLVSQANSLCVAPKLPQKGSSIKEGDSIEGIIQGVLEMQNRYSALKDEVTLVYKNENAFLRSMLANMQEIQQQDRKMVSYLQKELERLQGDLNLQRKKQ